MAPLTRALALYGNHFLLRRSPVIVFSMERSGSVALFQSLLAHGVFAVATHYLSPEKVRRGARTSNGSARWAARHIIARRKPAKIISLVRHPIDNMVSTFARGDFGDRGQCADQARGGTIDAGPLVERFHRQYLASGRYQHPLRWFDREFRPALGVDVYAHPFDKQRGAARIAAPPYDILLMRTELPDDEKARVVGPFLGLPEFTMVSAAGKPAKADLAPGRAGEQSAYGALYKVLKCHVTVPKEYLDAIIASRYAQHFFPAEILDAMRDRYGDPLECGE